MKKKQLLKTVLLLGVGWGIALIAFANSAPSTLILTSHEGTEQPQDWLNLGDESSDVQDAQRPRTFVSPMSGSIVHQTPPEFTWASITTVDDPEVLYELQLLYPDNSMVTIQTDKSWVNGQPGFLLGNIEPYWWRVRALKNGAVEKDWSEFRAFFVAGASLYAGIPNIGVLYQTAAAKARPRTFPTGDDLEVLRAKFVGLNASFRAEWSSVKYDAMVKLARPLETPETFNIDSEYLLKGVLVGRIENDGSYIQGVKARLLNMASWDANDPNLMCDWGNPGQKCRAMTVYMALLYDWLYHDMTADERLQVKDAILAKLERGTDGISTGMDHYTEHLPHYPMESWLSRTLKQMAIITTVMAGEDAGFESRFRYHMPYFLTNGYGWGGADGSMNNSLNYGAISLEDIILSFHVVSKVTGYDLSLKQFYNSMPYFWLYFQPPIAEDRIVRSSAMFGDGAEQPIFSYYLRARLHAIVSHFYQSKQDIANSIRWYANHQYGNNEVAARIVHWLWLLNPIERSPVTDIPAPNLLTSALFPAGGMAAIHSSITDLDRTSIYFKSSPYGTISHNHADQNSFVVHKGGIPLLIDSGYYNAYNDDYYNGWYNQTKAHNAITYDGGQGQKLDTRRAIGSIIKYFYDGYYGDLTEVIGDATKAYGGALNEAKRTLIYSKYGIILVHDKLSSDISRVWEWNLHAVNEMELLSDNEVKITHHGETACVAVHSLSPVSFNQTTDTGIPNAQESAPQWHGRFSTISAGKSNEFLTIIRVGCGKNATVTPSSTGWKIDFFPRVFEVKDGMVTYGSATS